MSGTDGNGTLDEALERLHTTGPEYRGRLSNHGPMVVEALVRRGRSADVHRWLDGYRRRLQGMPERTEAVTRANWREALGDPRRVADWTAHFAAETGERPWREVLAEWWPRLLPGITASATHSVIRTGHAVQALLDGGESRPRLSELAHSLGYWAARHQTLPRTRTPLVPADAGAALDAVPAVPRQRGGIQDRLAQLSALPDWPAATEPEAARDQLAALVTAAVHRYATHGHVDPVMLVHSATAPHAVLRTLPALPRGLWPVSLATAWSASAAVTAAYTAPAPVAHPVGDGGCTPEEVLERAVSHGDDHAIKFTDTALAVGGRTATAAALSAFTLIPPAAG
ncbi:hypothetical protein SZN_21596 [Streptomyces zinciresistens K42]|uniref:DUF4243 domain-containing protein n=1 Tax=Streptomyces zinciresistens K42 TaxID=700597 RepID=G2GFN5_9ACTN|nr:questin oxidase family protein [Streptomyces zinciresistens]EGX57691.1 hypothetical protein SZN_21596 [Streptomyces zinciresistens K42]